LLWASNVWTTRDKVIGTLLVPGGLALFFYLATETLAAGCSGVSDASGRVIEDNCHDPSLLTQVAGWALLAVLVLAPIFTSIYLALRMRGPSGEARAT
jgi:hypothetical protein